MALPQTFCIKWQIDFQDNHYWDHRNHDHDHKVTNDQLQTRLYDYMIIWLYDYMIIWCLFNSTVDGTPRDFLWRDKLILRIMNIRIWWSYNNILLFGIFKLFGTWWSDNNHRDQMDEHQLQINFAGASGADYPCYVSFICMLTNKYQKYKPVELEDQLLWP